MVWEVKWKTESIYSKDVEIIRTTTTIVGIYVNFQLTPIIEVYY